MRESRRWERAEFRVTAGQYCDAGTTCQGARSQVRDGLRESTNLLERSLGEVKRRTKVIGRFPAETSRLSLCWAVLDLVIAGANHVRFDDLDRQLTQPIATEHHRSHEQKVVAAYNPAGASAEANLQRSGDVTPSSGSGGGIQRPGRFRPQPRSR